jgi:DNA invertase Pin-like site-specific DNA recombinase
MGRKQVLDFEQIEQIRDLYQSGTPVKELAASYGVSTLLIYRVINKKGAYAPKPQLMGTPILDSHGQVVNIEVTGQG